MSLLIKNVAVIDGTGRPQQKSDVLIRGKRILSVGRFPRFRARKVIDGMGAYLAPGFIDTCSRVDRFFDLFINPEQGWLLRQGITTILGGQCGISLAPLFHNASSLFYELNPRRRFNMNWETSRQFFRAMRDRRMGVNFGTFAGHASMRGGVTHEDMRNLNGNELNVLYGIAEDSLKEGFFGISFGAGYSALHPFFESELRALFPLIKKSKTVAAIHFPDGDKGLFPALLSVLREGNHAGIPILVNHMDSSMEYLRLLDYASGQFPGAPIYFSVSVNELKIMPCISFLPLWAREDAERDIFKEEEIVLRQLKNPSIRKKILKELPRLKGDRIIITHAPRLPYAAGITLLRFCKERNFTLGEGLLSLIEMTGGKAHIEVSNPRHDSLIKILQSDKTFLTANASGFEKSDDAPFAKFLEIVFKNKIMPIEAAVNKLTGLPASVLRLKGRGFIKRGFFADLVLFRDDGISDVFVNGEHAIEKGKATGVLDGKIIKL